MTMSESGSVALPGVASESSALERARRSEPSNVIQISNLVKIYRKASQQLRVLDGLQLSIKQGAFDALMGPSGSGKSTLLNIIAGLDQADQGTVRVAGADLHTLSDGERAHFRAQKIGFVFQTYNTLPVLTALENVELPLLLTRLPKAERRKRAATALRIVGLEGRSEHFPNQLSGGQEQRVAIARAIVTDPELIVADEPTGDLDRESANGILDLLARLNAEFGKSILMVTHDPAAAERASAVHRLEKGQLLADVN